MEDKIKGIIKKEFRAKVLDVERITEGYSHFMYLVKIDKAPGELIIRFSSNIKPAVSIAKEKFIIETLRKRRIPAPKILAFYFPENKKEEGYMVLEKFSGQSLDVIWDSLEREDKLSITVKIGKLLKDIHSIKFDSFGEIEENGYIEKDSPFKFRDAKKTNINKCKRVHLKDQLRYISRTSLYDIASDKFLKDYLDYILNNRELLEYEGKPCLNHGDFFPGHIFVIKKGKEYFIEGIIDFEFACSFNPENDFVKLHRSGFFHISELKEAFEKGYGSEVDIERADMHRIMRDFGFATYLLESGSTTLPKKIFLDVERMINEKKSKNKLEFFEFP